jgi:hypothetical protein
MLGQHAELIWFYTIRVRSTISLHEFILGKFIVNFKSCLRLGKNNGAIAWPRIPARRAKAKEPGKEFSFLMKKKVAKLAASVRAKENFYLREEIMKKSLVLLLLPMLSIAVYCQALAGENTHSGQAIRESGQAAKASAEASGHASASAAHALVGSGQVVSAAASVPLAIGGAALTSAGSASTAAAKGLQQAAVAPAGKPLKITEESMTIIPPDQALKQ